MNEDCQKTCSTGKDVTLRLVKTLSIGRVLKIAYGFNRQESKTDA